MAKTKKKTAVKAESKMSTIRIWAVLRLLMGVIFLWPFFDKMIGLGYTTCLTADPISKVESVEVLCKKSAAKGGSPTTGFLKFAAKGPLKETYNNLAGNKIVDVLFMSGLLLIGLSLLTGVGVKIAAVSGVLLMLLMWSAVLPGENNPVLDDHIIYAVVLLGIMKSNKEQVWGLGKWWQKQPIVKKYPILA